ncbi:DUF4956 domain-containing protein [Furfurilactobacillus siliginis]|uniref:DUF4956 domain-containing protein n=1 Tax=Furfurilactobacillus siliginis TaxID=348151 RepID=A0A0R2KWK0_9LACO|nr:DUF4956 domain-containing protein [Furfurilactobacillus siliginis]KRN93870.1 hypothetical protein IV55_GL000672 [Furfurilactobacillus siliginis]GEK29048.1 DUF4956 domain-containing protein [Furfurilactobacillus siliginis]
MLVSYLGPKHHLVTFEQVLITTLVTLILGLIVALVYMYHNHYSKHFIFAVALLPIMVQSIIMTVHGNLGAGLTVAGAFSLVRFRSAPGNAREMVTIFFAMTIGLATGRGYLLYAAFFTIVVSLAMLLYTMLDFGASDSNERIMKITIPENLDYEHEFNDLFDEYTKETTIDTVRTTNLGSLFEIQYHIILKDVNKQKAFMDAIRERNGNLEVSLRNDTGRTANII